MAEDIHSSNSVHRITAAVLAKWPQHARFIQNGIRARAGDQAQVTDETAEAVARLIGDRIDRFVDGYRWMCEMILAEEIEFRRTGRYRYSSLVEVNDQVYQDQELMTRYMDGLLLSQVLFDNHLAMLEFYRNRFLTRNVASYRHLEIGPGHGLLLYYAAIDPRCGAASVWDISPTSLAHTRACLEKLGVGRDVAFELRDIGEVTAGEFDSIVFSEVLEHLEAPHQALSVIRDLLSHRGYLFVNVPVNSPAIDHIFLLNSPEEAVELVSSVGLDIIEVRTAPATGYTDEKARRTRSAISCGIIAKRATQ